MKWLMIFILFTACSPLTRQQKTENKVARKLKKLEAKFPEAFKNSTTELVRIDTVIKEIQIQGSTSIDTFLVTEVLKEFQLDSIEVPVFITRFLEVTRDTVLIDTLDVHLWIAGTAVDYRMHRDEMHIEKEQEVRTMTITDTQVIRKRFYQDWLFWLFVISATVLYVLSKMGKITIKLPKL